MTNGLTLSTEDGCGICATYAVSERKHVNFTAVEILRAAASFGVGAEDLIEAVAQGPDHVTVDHGKVEHSALDATLKQIRDVTLTGAWAFSAQPSESCPCSETGDITTSCIIDGIFDHVRKDDLAILDEGAECGLITVGQRSELFMANKAIGAFALYPAVRNIVEMSLGCETLVHCVRDAAELVHFADEEKGQVRVFTVHADGCSVDSSAFGDNQSDKAKQAEMLLRALESGEDVGLCLAVSFSDKGIAIETERGSVDLGRNKVSAAWIADLIEQKCSLLRLPEAAGLAFVCENRKIFIS